MRLRSGFTILLHCWESPSNDDRNRRSYVLCIKCWEEEMSVVSRRCKGGFFLLLIVIISHLDRKDLKKSYSFIRPFSSVVLSWWEFHHFISFHFQEKKHCTVKLIFLHKSIEINQIKVTLLRALVLYSLLVRVGTHAQDLERNTICLSQISPASLPLPTYSAVEY